MLPPTSCVKGKSHQGLVSSLNLSTDAGLHPASKYFKACSARTKQEILGRGGGFRSPLPHHAKWPSHSLPPAANNQSFLSFFHSLLTICAHQIRHGTGRRVATLSIFMSSGETTNICTFDVSNAISKSRNGMGSIAHLCIFAIAESQICDVGCFWKHKWIEDGSWWV